jgi:hypothetical protein
VGLAAAGPALATEIPEPTPVPVVAPEVPPVPEPPALPTIPIPELPPELVEPPVVVTDIDADNIDVSVRVLSPGEDGPPKPESTVVSPDSKPDITVTPDPSEVVSEAVTEHTVDEGDPAPIAGAVNTNISIRVLSPGDNEDVTQDAVAPDEKPAPDAEPRTEGTNREPSQAATPTFDDGRDSEQYQDDNSQYQYDPKIASDPWNWRWLLTVDCAGNANSSSLDSGDPGSLEWSWEWKWEWGCGGTGDDSAPVPTQGTTSGLSPPATASTGPTGNETASSPAPTGAGSSAPWNWTWSFTFCGKTTTFTTSAGEGTPLTWTWGWIWNWTCPNAAVDEQPADATPPAPYEIPPLVTSPPAMDERPPAANEAGDASGGVTPLQIGPVAIDLPTGWLPTGWLPTGWLPTGWLPTVPVGTTTGTAGTHALPSWPTAIGITFELAIPPAISSAGPLVTAPVPLVSPIDADRPATPTAAAPTTTPRPSTTRGLLPSFPPATSHETASRDGSGSRDEARPAHEGHKDPPRVTRASSVSLPSIPSVPRSRPGLGSSSAGGVGTSAILVGVAALTGFVLLAAPGLGRRIRVARELSPGSPDSLPIDHPG